MNSPVRTGPRPGPSILERLPCVSDIGQYTALQNKKRGQNEKLIMTIISLGTPGTIMCRVL